MRKGNSFASEAKNPEQLLQIKNVSTHPCEEVFSWGMFLFLFINIIFSQFKVQTSASESNLPMSRGSSPSSCMILGKFLNQFLFYYKMGKLTLTLHCCCED